MDELILPGSCTQEQLEDIDAWKDDQGTDDEVPSEEVSLEHLAEVSRKGMTSDDLQRMHDALNNMMRSRCDSEEDLTLKIPKKPALNGISKIRKYVPSMHKIHAFPFPEDELEELNTIWVKKTIKRFNLYARYVVDHWKRPWAQQAHIRRQLKIRDDFLHQ
ncbi:hypothetical protein Tco_0799829 [Tanacetum coccineum]|uniref:Uncharacterized protein n=1 Tax=Tanacetum coccineum TaxID=301880 RepID=A0ABQ4ZTQ3_9ASTR